MVERTRRGVLAGVGAGLAATAGCLGGGESSVDPAVQPSDAGPPPAADATLPLPASPSELRADARSGGPDKDGIPSIDDPSFLPPGAADFLDPGDPVFGVVRDGNARAYPQAILAHHEVVNDTLAGDPVAVTYCPLTGTVQGFDRGPTTFGVSGRLLNNNLVMYDRATETWWPQMLATAIPGPWNGDPEVRSLREFRLVWTTWERWRNHHPDTGVLSTDTGHARNYADDPYGDYNPPRGYYADDGTLFPERVDDDRLHPKAVVLGARAPDGALAVRKDGLLDADLLTGRLGDTPALAVADHRYETGYVYRNPGGREFTHDGDRVRADGEAFAPDALPLERVHTFDAMWFAWVGYYPDTALVPAVSDG
jgi:hypothetical protein